MKLISSEDLVRLNVLMTHEELETFLEGFLKVCVEETLKVLPSVVGHLVRSAANLQGMSEEFYDKNKDLVDHKAQVAKVMERLEGESPGKNLRDLLKETGVETRRVVGLQKGFDLNPTPRPSVVDMDAGFGEL